MTDDEARLIFIETNIHQTDLAKLNHSNLSILVNDYYEVIKAQGRRSDLVRDVYQTLSEIEGGDYLTSRPLGKKLNSALETGNKFQMSPRTVSRYLRIHKLIDSLKNLLDKGKISVRAAVELSYLKEKLQQDVVEFATNNKPISEKEGILLREQYERGIDVKVCETLLLYRARNSNAASIKGFPPMTYIYRKYRMDKYERKEIETIVDKALNLYYMERKNNKNIY